MGRRKIEILPIQNERNRSVTFLKRKTGLFKKAYELGVLCSVDVAVIIFERRHGHPDKLYQYCSTDIGSIVQRHIRFDGERDTRTPHDFSGGTDASRLDDAGDDDDDADADDPAPPQRKRQDSSSTAAAGPSAKGKKADGGKMVPIKPESMTIDVDYRTLSSSHLSMPPSASPTLPISSDRHTSATHSPTRAHPSSSSSSSAGAGGYALPSNKRARLAPASELDRHPSLHASSPGGAHTPFPYRLDLDAASAHPSLHAHAHAPPPPPLPPHVHTTPYASFFPPSAHAAHGAPFLNPSASFARASLAAPYSHPPPQSLSHSHQQQQQQQHGLYGTGSMLRAPQQQQQPLPRISQPPTPHHQQHHQHHQQHSPDDLFAGVFGPPSSSSGSGSAGGSSTVGSGGMFGGGGGGSGGGGGMMMGGGVGGVETFFGIPLTFDWPQLSQPPAHRQSTDSGTSGDNGGSGSGSGNGGQTWLDFLSGTAPAPLGEGLLGSVGAESGGGARGGKRGRGDGEGKGEDEGRRGGDGDVSLEDIVGGGGGGGDVDRGA